MPLLLPFLPQQLVGRSKGQWWQTSSSSLCLGSKRSIVDDMALLWIMFYLENSLH
jgi:hypothetical protein